VELAMRGRGVGRALIDAAETHAHASGHREIASDAELENAGGIAAHGAVGYEEVERTVCFRKSLSGG
jgi:aminoglycoside 6'-N-acetyltransferase I